MNKCIAEEKDINDKIFWKYSKYQNPSFLTKYLIRAKQVKNKQLVNNRTDELIDLRNTINKKELSENENPNKIVDIVEKIINFDKQQKGKWIKILTPKQMLQRLAIALTQVKLGNASEKLLNEIREIIYFLYQNKEITKNVYNNITSSVKLYGYYINKFWK